MPWIFLSSMLGLLVLTQTQLPSLSEFRHLRQVCWCLLFLATIIFYRQPGMHWLFIGIILITLKFSPKIFHFFRQRRLRKCLIPLCDALILSMQAGRPLRLATADAIDNFSGWQKNLLQEMLLNAFVGEASEQVSEPHIRQFLTDLRDIEQSQNKVIEQLRALRRQLKICDDLRRKSGQLSEQAHAQAAVITMLFLALLTYVVGQFGYAQHWRLILFATLLFAAGIVLIIRIGRSFKWTI